ncbi:MAG: hypothetical protein NVSMB9_18270 [Isosphaeraceae bacterium]
MTSRIVRISLLLLGVAGFLFWTAHHTEVTSGEGVQSIRDALRIERGELSGGLIGSTGHPLHSLAIAAARSLISGDGPYTWQTAAQLAAMAAMVLTVVPVYLLGLNLFDDDATAGLGCVLFFANPLISSISVNVLSETTFLFFWTWGLWASIRFLREGRFLWLPWAIAFGSLAYLTRPEGLLLHLALAATLLVLPLHKKTHIHWPRWWAALVMLVIGPLLLVGPYVALKGGLGTRPAVARVIGTMEESPPAALERERPLPPTQTGSQTYAIATTRVVQAVGEAVTWPLIPFVVLGLLVGRKVDGRTRAWLFLGLVIAGSSAGLVRLHATAGYCTARHALVPGLLLTLAAGHGLVWVMRRASIDGRRLGLGEGRLRPGPAVWALLIVGGCGWPFYRSMTPFNSSFAPYRIAGTRLLELAKDDSGILDLTDWSLFYWGRPGHGIEKVGEASTRPGTRWLVVRDSQLAGEGPLGSRARELVAGREPVARCPEHPATRQLQVLIYDLSKPTLSAHQRNGGDLKRR